MRNSEEFRVLRLRAAVPFWSVVCVCLTVIFVTIWVF